jgi:hypothetical protein
VVQIRASAPHSLMVVQMATDRLKYVIDGSALLVSIAAVCFTLYYQHLQKPQLELGIGQDVFLNGLPRVGLLCNISNSGAKPGTIIRGELNWTPTHRLYLNMISPQFESWSITRKADRQVATGTTYSPLPPIVIQPRSSQAVVLWFTGDVPPGIFTAGEQNPEVLLYDGIHSEPVAKRKFQLVLQPKDIADISNPDFQGTEIPIRRTTLYPPADRQ